jgi:hypothetical protein
LPRQRLWIVLLLLQASLTVFLIADSRLGVLPALELLGGELLFGLGVWLLARGFFSDPRTVFFVTAAALGSSLGDKVYAALPLLVFLGRRFVQTGSAAALFGTLALAALHAWAAPHGLFFLAPIAAAILLWSAGHRKVPLTRSHIPALIGGFALAVAVAVRIGRGAGEAPEPMSWGRAFLAFVGLDAPAGFLDLFIGIAPRRDASCYVGYLTLAFAIVGLARLDRRMEVRSLAVGATLFLGLGLLAATSYVLLPSLHSGRPISVVAPLLKLFLAFLAGAGLENASRKATAAVATGLICLAIALSAASLRLQVEPRIPDRAAALFAPGAPEVLSPIFQSSTVCEFLDTSALWAAVAAGLLFLLRSRPRAMPLAMALLLFLHPLDVFSWKFRTTWVRTAREVQTR